MYNEKYKLPFIIIVSVILFSGCKKRDTMVTNKTVNRAVLVYMAANNDLRTDAINCINRMEAGVSGNNNLLVFIKTTSEASYILKIKHDNTDEIVSDTIMYYGGENTSDPQFLSKVIMDARKLAPAESYGLVLWSHASSWAPPTGIRTKSFGEDRGSDMDIIAMKDALPTDLSYLIFDACSMGSVESVYELRNNAAYIIASPTEVLSSSYPYEQIIQNLFGDENDLKVVAQKFMDYYKGQKGDYASATVSLIKTEGLMLLAQYAKGLLDNEMPGENFNSTQVQRLDFDSKTRVPAYDLADFLRHNYSEESCHIILEQLNKVVLFKDHTTSFLGGSIMTFCGLSVYLPEKNDSFKSYYSRLEWFGGSGWYHLFGDTLQ